MNHRSTETREPEVARFAPDSCADPVPDRETAPATEPRPPVIWRAGRRVRRMPV